MSPKREPKHPAKILPGDHKGEPLSCGSQRAKTEHIYKNKQTNKQIFRFVTVQLSLQNAKVHLGKLERILPSINFRVNFLRIHRKEVYKSMDPTTIPPKLSARNWFKEMETLHHQLFGIWVSCGFFKRVKRDL